MGVSISGGTPQASLNDHHEESTVTNQRWRYLIHGSMTSISVGGSPGALHLAISVASVHGGYIVAQLTRLGLTTPRFRVLNG